MCDEILHIDIYSLIIEDLFAGISWYYLFINRKTVARELKDLLAISLVSKDFRREFHKYAYFPTRGQNLFSNVTTIERYINLIDKDKKIVWADDGRAGDYEEACNVSCYYTTKLSHTIIIIRCDDFIYNCPDVYAMGEYRIIIDNDSIYYITHIISDMIDKEPNNLDNRIQGILRALDIPMYVGDYTYKSFDHFWYKETYDTPMHAMTYCEDYID